MHDRLPHTVAGDTLADSINVPKPRNWRRAVQAIRESNGDMVCVSDDQILAAMRSAGANGVFAEPAAAASVAGIEVARADGLLSKSDTVVAMITGAGRSEARPWYFREIHHPRYALAATLLSLILVISRFLFYKSYIFQNETVQSSSVL